MSDVNIDIKYADPQVILERVRASQITGADPLSPDELAALALRIEQSSDILDKGVLLRALAFTGDDRYRYILDSFLGGPYPTLAGRALWYLCVYWGLTSEYLDTMLGYLKGMPWDTLDDCRLMTLNLLSGYLPSYDEPQLVEAILNLAESPTVDRQIQMQAMNFLYNFVGDPEVDVIPRAKELLQKQKQERNSSIS